MFASSRQHPQRRRMGRCAEAGCRTLPGKVSRIYFRADAGFANPDIYEFLEAERIKYAIRLPANRILPRKDRPSAEAPRWTSAALLCELHLSSRELDKIPPGRRAQGVNADGTVVVG